MNDKSYYGGFEQEEVDQMFEAMKCNYGAWVSGFAPQAIGVADNMNSQAVVDFSRTLLSMRPEVALNVSMTIFQSDFRSILPQVSIDQTLSLQGYVWKSIFGKVVQIYYSSGRCAYSFEQHSRIVEDSYVDSICAQCFLIFNSFCMLQLIRMEQKIQPTP